MNNEEIKNEELENKCNSETTNEVVQNEAEVEVNVIDNRDEQAAKLIQWGAARAGVIVLTPFLGTAALIANEVYMITRIGDIYGINLSKKAVLSFLGSLGATVIGNLASTLIPVSIIQGPIAISVTYGIGRAAQKWIKDGMPDDTKPYREIFETEKVQGDEKMEELKNNESKNQPLGNEKEDFTNELEKLEDAYQEKAHEAVNKMADQLSETVEILGDKLINVLKKTGVTEEQIEDAKYKVLGASEVAQETAQKAIIEFIEQVETRSKEFHKEAKKCAEEMKVKAKKQMEELQKKKEILRHKSEIKSLQAKQKSEELKLQAKIHMEKVKEKTDKLKEDMKEKAGQVQVKVEEIKGKAKETAVTYKTAANEAIEQTKGKILTAAEEFKEKAEERAAEKKAKAKNEKE